MQAASADRHRGLQRAKSGSVPGGCGKACGSGGLGLYKAIETDAHSWGAVWEMFTTQTHSSPPDMPQPGFHSADSINSRRNVFKPSQRKESYCSCLCKAELDGIWGVIALTASSIGTLCEFPLAPLL